MFSVPLYNESGIRAQKTVNNVVTDYVLSGSTILSQKTGNNEIVYNVDGAGRIGRFEYNNTKYFYMYNAQGDVIGVTDVDSNVVALYTYDSWGKPLAITDANGNDVSGNTSHIANINPLRYRGYYWDSETGLFYVNSRYYDPETGRFINADNQVQTSGTDMTGMNLFAYCGNNPANRIDPTGEAWWHWAIGAAIVVACAAAVVVTAGGALAAMGAVAAVGSGVAASTTAATIAAGAFIGSATALGTAWAIAGATSSSNKDLMAKGNWGTVAGVAGGAVIGGGSAYLDSRGSGSSSNSNSKLNKYVDNPQKIKNVSPLKIEGIAIKENLNYGTLSKGAHAGQGFKVTWGGDRLLQYHPGGGHHGPSSYWKVSSGELGTIRIFND